MGGVGWGGASVDVLCTKCEILLWCCVVSVVDLHTSSVLACSITCKTRQQNCSIEEVLVFDVAGLASLVCIEQSVLFV